MIPTQHIAEISDGPSVQHQMRRSTKSHSIKPKIKEEEMSINAIKRLRGRGITSMLPIQLFLLEKQLLAQQNIIKNFTATTSNCIRLLGHVTAVNKANGTTKVLGADPYKEFVHHL
ncbi:predicted protein [Coccidioides posadasii str. Silveira]|uniref:Predicted protein n=1 Tax=Coccidioides posadasii (strain RMSCC 757 / Silveira) TaxID=443226 RepID=E9D561_COCPS|nr:predicted protein [Coccidioides posadasii str. Silveira]